MKRSLVLVFLLLIVGQSFSQKKPQAIKFDEFEDTEEFWFHSDLEPSLAERIRRYVNALKKAPGVTAYIIYYRARLASVYDESKSSSWASNAVWTIRDQLKFKEEKMVAVNGGFRERNSIEFWIVPRIAELPSPTPTFAESETFLCPDYSVISDGFYFEKTKPISFHVWTSSKNSVTYKWKVSSGDIIEGGDSETVKINIGDSSPSRLTVYVEVAGLPLPCRHVFYSSIDVAPKPFLVDQEARYNYSSLSARVDTFMAIVNANPEMVGYIVVYASRSGGSWERDLGLASVSKAFVFRRYDLTRVKIVKGGYREYNSVDFWLLPPGVAPPAATPSVDRRFVQSRKKTKQGTLQH